MTLPDDPTEFIMCHKENRRRANHGRIQACPICNSRGYYCFNVPYEDRKQAGRGVTVIHAARHKDYPLEEMEA